MYIILNQGGQTIGYIQNQFIMDQSKENILGILIGDCFFGKQPSIVGKIFNGTAYLINGEIVGKVVLDTTYKSVVPKKSHMLEAWDILSNVKLIIPSQLHQKHHLLR